VRYVEYVRSRPPRSIQKANVMTSQQIHPALLPRPGAGQRGDKIKSALKTTELVAYVLTVIGVLVASDLVGDTPGGRADYFLADKAWLYIVALTIGYMLSRGLAKSGKHNDSETDRYR